MKIWNQMALMAGPNVESDVAAVEGRSIPPAAELSALEPRKQPQLLLFCRHGYGACFICHTPYCLFLYAAHASRGHLAWWNGLLNKCEKAAMRRSAAIMHNICSLCNDLRCSCRFSARGLTSSRLLPRRCKGLDQCAARKGFCASV